MRAVRHNHNVRLVSVCRTEVRWGQSKVQADGRRDGLGPYRILPGYVFAQI